MRVVALGDVYADQVASAAELLGSAGGQFDCPPTQRFVGTDAYRSVLESGVDLVRITAVVQDRRGRPVLGLLPSDFELNAGGEPVQIVEFGSEATGVSVALLIDDSGSMSLAGRREAALADICHLVLCLNEFVYVD